MCDHAVVVFGQADVACGSLLTRDLNGDVTGMNGRSGSGHDWSLATFDLGDIFMPNAHVNLQLLDDRMA